MRGCIGERPCVFTSAGSPCMEWTCRLHFRRQSACDHVLGSCEMPSGQLRLPRDSVTGSVLPTKALLRVDRARARKFTAWGLAMGRSNPQASICAHHTPGLVLSRARQCPIPPPSASAKISQSPLRSGSIYKSQHPQWGPRMAKAIKQDRQELFTTQQLLV